MICFGEIGFEAYNNTKELNMVIDFDKGALRSGFDLLREKELVFFDTIKEDLVEKIFAGEHFHVGHNSTKDTLKVVAKVAHQCKDFEDFQDFVVNGNIPPIKLSEDELELLRGGAQKQTFGHIIISVNFGNIFK